MIWLLLLLAPAAVGTASAEPTRMSMAAFGERAVIEVRDLPADAAHTAVEEALAAIREIERLTGPGSGVAGGVGEINAAAGQGPQPAASELVAILERALLFCEWSDGAHGPLGAQLYDLWGRGRPILAPPPQPALDAATNAADCRNVRVDATAGSVELAAGGRLDLEHFARGGAVDRAVAVLEAAGAGNLWVEVGGVRRGLGGGPDGRGWQVQLPLFGTMTRPLDPLWISDRALVIADVTRRPLAVGDLSPAAFLDQRTPKDPLIAPRSGRPPSGIQAVATSTDLALDAEALAAALLILGNHAGEQRLGVLRPKPAALWVLGTGEGMPVLSSYNWSTLTLR